MRIITSPTVQLGLNLPYPSLRPKQRELRFVGVHRRPPGISASSLPTCWPPSPCARLSRARTTTGPPPHPRPSADNGHSPRRRTGRPVGGDRGWFPRSPHDRSAREVPSSTPTASPSPTPQTFSVASPPVKVSGFGVDPPALGRSCAAPRPRSARFGAGTTITGLQPLVHSRYTLWPRLPDPARLAVPSRP